MKPWLYYLFVSVVAVLVSRAIDKASPSRSRGERVLKFLCVWIIILGLRALVQR